MKKSSKKLLISILILCVVSGFACMFLRNIFYNEEKDSEKDSKEVETKDVAKDIMPRFHLPNDWQFSDTKANLKLHLVEIEEVGMLNDTYDVVIKGVAYTNEEFPIKLHLKIDVIVGTEDYYVSDVVSVYTEGNKAIENTFDGWKRAYLFHLQTTLISRK